MTAKKNYIYGLHAVSALLKNHPERLVQLYVLKDRHDQRIEEIVKLAEIENIPMTRLTARELGRMSETESHQGIVALSAKAKAFEEEDLNDILQQAKSAPFLLILDGVQDPHNLGACFRSADAAGVQAIIAPKDNAVGITPVVSKVASGAIETVPFVQVTNLARTLRELKEQGIWIFGAAAEATQTCYQTDFTGPIAIVLGAEGKGLRRLTRDECDGLIKIPMSGSVSSLNVSVAAGIFLFEVVRQRSDKVHDN